MVTQIQDTMIKQLSAQNPAWSTDHSVKTVLLMSDGITIRLCHRRGRRVVNIDITYNRGSDLYSVKAYLIRHSGLEVTTIYDESGFFWDQLDMVIGSVLRKAEEEAEKQNTKPQAKGVRIWID